MAFVVAVLMLLGAALCKYETEWNKFKIAYGKKYSKEEEASRFAIFRDNMAYIALLNKMDKSATYGVTKFADLSAEEFAVKHLGYIPSGDIEDLPTNNLGTFAAPSAYDWVAQGVVNEVQDQGSCGSCWAFSTTATMESAYAISHGTLYKFSEQQLIDCDKSQAGCDGGNHNSSPKYLTTVGQVYEELYPYAGVTGTCSLDDSWTYYKAKSYSKVGSSSQDPVSKEVDMTDALYKYGPLLIGLNATPVQFYTGGILNPSSCSTSSNHAVVIVGYGSESGLDFWKIRNSWGPSWGEQGYFRIVRGKNMCGLAGSPVYIIA